MMKISEDLLAQAEQESLSACGTNHQEGRTRAAIYVVGARLAELLEQIVPLPCGKADLGYPVPCTLRHGHPGMCNYEAGPPPCLNVTRIQGVAGGVHERWLCTQNQGHTGACNEGRVEYR